MVHSHVRSTLTGLCSNVVSDHEACVPECTSMDTSLVRDIVTETRYNYTFVAF